MRGNIIKKYLHLKDSPALASNENTNMVYLHAHSSRIPQVFPLPDRAAEPKQNLTLSNRFFLLITHTSSCSKD